MRPNQQQFARTGTKPVETVRMQIDPESAEFLMNVFTDLYSDTMMAPIREYISNALDSHAEAGQTRPIDVRKPSGLRPFFEVEDYGVGMSLDTVRRVYSMYGYSTKRHSDEYIGMLGLGSKCGLTYANSMNITSVHDGTMVHFTISRGNKDANGRVTGSGADIDIHAVRPTDKPNGVKVQLPVADPAEFSRKIDQFVMYARPGTIAVDGKVVEPDLPGTQITDDIFLRRGTGWERINEDVIVAGGIPYRAGGRLSGDLPYGSNVVAYVPVGTVEFTPSREDLQYTNRTNQAIEDIKATIKSELRAAAQADIDGAEQYGEAWLRYERDWSSIAPDIKYRGAEFPRRYVSADIDHSFDPRRHRNAVSSGKTGVVARSLQNTLLVQNYPNQTVTTPTRAKVREYINNMSETIDKVWFVSDTRRPLHPWDDTLHVVDFETIKAVKVPRAPRKSAADVKSEPSIEIYDASSPRYDKRREIKYTELPPGDVLLVSPSDLKSDNRYDGEASLSDVAKVYPDRTIVVIGSNRFDKFEREYSGRDIVRFSRKNLRDKYELFVAGLTSGQRMALNRTSDVQGVLSRLRKVDDPDVQDVIDQLRTDHTDVRNQQGAYLRIFRAIDRLSARSEVEAPDLSTISNQYPLLQHLAGRAPVEAVEQYINLLYQEEQA